MRQRPKFDQFFIERMKWPPKFSMNGNHMHAYFELYYLLKGTRSYFVGHSLYTVRPHDIMLIRGGDLHHTTYSTDEASERILIYFDEKILNRLYDTFGKEQILKCFEHPKCTIPEEKQEEVLQLFSSMIKEQSIADEYSLSLLQNQLEELLLLLIRIQKEAKPDSSDALNDVDITTAARYICSNYQKELTLSEVAAVANISPTYFSKKFKSVTGFGFKEYLNRIRLREAANLLLQTEHSITKIALQCGFNDSNYFGDSFKKIYKMSPRAFRKQNK